jgi:hypothetical protein
MNKCRYKDQPCILEVIQVASCPCMECVSDSLREHERKLDESDIYDCRVE